MNNRLIKSNNAGGGGGCTDIVDNYDPFAGNGVALYQLNGDATDVSGSYNGTATSVTYGTGVFGQAGVFNGSSSYVENSNIPNEICKGYYTVNVWAYIPSSQAFASVVHFQDDNNGHLPNFNIAANNSNWYVGVRSNSSSNLTSTNVPITFNSWNMITVVLHSGGGKFYLNGSEVASASFTPVFTTNTSCKFSLGRTNQGWISSVSAYLNGSIDQVRIFNTALTPLEVEALYTEELCICDGTVDTLQVLGDSSCIATYQLDGNANDLSGNYSGTATAVSYGVGEFDLAGVFNGTSSNISTFSLNQSNAFSLSGWFNPISSGTMFLFSTDTGDEPRGFQFKTDFLYTGSVLNYPTLSYTVNQWNHFVLTYNGSNQIKIYTNNSLQVTYDLSFNSVTRPLCIGNRFAGNTIEGFNGQIDQARIFNKVLNATEVTTLYNETACTPAACTSGTTNTLNILGDGSCIATYTLDGTPADLSGNYNGVQGGNVTYPQGYFDLAAAFGGSGKGIDLPSNVPVAGQINCSVSLWFNVLNNTKKETLVRFANNDEVLLRINTNGTLDLLGVRQSNSTYISYTTAGSYNNGVWHYLVMTRESGSIKFYIDNVLDNTLSWNNTFITAANETAIGYDGFASASVLSGSIDQVRIFNKALSAGEVTTLYNETPCN